MQSLLRKEGSADVVISNYSGPLADRRILDVGCGPGTVLQFLSDVNYTGIDRNEGYISEARARYGSRGRFIDRGRKVRRADADRALAAAVFPKAELQMRSDLLRQPYNHAIMICSV